MAFLKSSYNTLNLSPTLELLDPLNPVRRRIALWLLPLGSLVAGGAYWASRPGGLDPVDRT
ncbi:MAG: GGDEF domain-containing protein, partial [Thermus sp.]